MEDLDTNFDFIAKYLKDHNSKVYVSPTPPEEPFEGDLEGDLWFDETTQSLKMYYVNPETCIGDWIDISGGGGARLFVQESAPVDAIKGDIWIDSNDGVQYIYIYDSNDSYQWVEFAGAAGNPGPEGPPGPAGPTIYDIAIFLGGTIKAAETLFRFNVVRPISLPANFLGSIATSRLGPINEYSLLFYKNSSYIGGITFSAESNTGSFSSVDATDFEIGDILELKAPNVFDKQLTDVAITLVADRI